MKKVYVQENRVTINGESCSFYEAGLYDIGNPECPDLDIFKDKEVIEEHLKDREGEECIIIFKTERTVKIIGFGQEVEVKLINEFEDDFEVKYIHPQTGCSQQEIEQLKTGWSFQNEEANKNYQKLISAIKAMMEDDVVFECCQDTDIVDIEKTTYGNIKEVKL